jgi:glutamate dehydrogenase (NADP+)
MSEPEFKQAVNEVFASIRPILGGHPEYQKAGIMDRIIEPERVIMFRVTWRDDAGIVRVNRGYRIQMNGAIGPYKGGLRFHPSVNLSIMKFLAFEQTFKNALTTLPMGGAKGGSDFDPKGKSDAEVERFCHAFMQELYRHIGENTDVPAGDIGVGAREIGYLFGMYKKLTNTFTGTFTGKGISWGGSLMRPQATGYGAVYFAEEMLKTKHDTLEGKLCSVSGAGNVAQYAIEKLMELGAKVVTASDSRGFIHVPGGFTTEKLAALQQYKNVDRLRIEAMEKRFEDVTFYPFDRPWGIPVDCAFPCATQNELNEADAIKLLKGGVKLCSEGANMPSTPEAVTKFQGAGILYAPGKAANAGGVSVSGLEMAQNSARLSWSAEEVDNRLKGIMKTIHDTCRATAERYGDPNNYVLGANIAGFIKVADSMVAQGLV